MKRTAIVSVIFPGNLVFFESFLKSLTTQQNKTFELLLIVDSIRDINMYLKDYLNLFKITTFHASGTVASIRQQAIKWLITQPFEYFVFADSDDRLSNDRVYVCCDYLKSCDIVVNDIAPFANELAIPQEGYWSDRLSDKKDITSADIVNYNLLGLGNTAIRKQVLKHITISENLIAVDWFIFFRWLQNASAIFVHDGIVQYRQHSSNTVGIKKITPHKLITVVEVKVAHYRALRNEFPFLIPTLLKNEKLLKELNADPAFCEATADYLNAKQINYFWWEETEYIHE